MDAPVTDTRRDTIAKKRDAVGRPQSEASSITPLPTPGSAHPNANPTGGNCQEEPKHRVGSVSPLPPRRFIAPSHVAKRLSVSERTVRYWAELGDLPGFKLGPTGKLWRFDPEDIDTYLEKRRPATRPALTNPSAPSDEEILGNSGKRGKAGYAQGSKSVRISVVRPGTEPFKRASSSRIRKVEERGQGRHQQIRRRHRR
jgi:excisionase family DNA binding protein